MATFLDATTEGFEAQFNTLLAAKRESSADVDAVVTNIVEDVRKRGDAALADYSRRFDQVDPDTVPLRVGVEEIEAAVATCDASALAALHFAHDRILDFHRRQKPENVSFTDALGVKLGWRWTAIDAVGLYVPGGIASYPSSVLMNAIPAKVAGCKRIAMAAPAPQGQMNPLVLAAAHIAGVDEVYRVGGAQAIAALAYGTRTIAAVNKIVGPGNAYVAAAKRRVFGQVGIDMIAGPSEIVVLADASADPAFVAADLLAQTEHDKAAQSILITNDRAWAETVSTEILRQLAELPRREIASASWQDYGAIIIVPSLERAVPLVDRIAPEHLEIIAGEATALTQAISHAGAIFIGPYTPEAIGDYVGGSNHVLPTSRSARFSSPLSVYDFVKRSSILSCDAEALTALGPAAITLGEAEGLSGHARSVALRLAKIAEKVAT